MEKYRKKLDTIDQKMKELFLERMEVVIEIAKYKKQHNLPVEDQSRENQMFQELFVNDPILKDLYTKFLLEIIAVSKIYQETLMKEE
ncbi:chorismate mutase [Hujiaoplasma nucleasis]|uniref:Chorismate mutase n=1 Tax=Hujiaoplasma nucleasis TaxID=2725268 RepID=A0A7L6N5S6_9MOLU|nr:chorismate mutase [Hujiaoplasma nucleasis]QLY40911.1 chorismate mutase [Hujiaoplasma nucleasis]